MFYEQVVIDEEYGGLAFEQEGERCAKLFADPRKTVMVMGNHGVLVTGKSVATAFNRLYYFERAAKTLVKAYGTGRELRVLSDKIAKATSQALHDYPALADAHFLELRAILDEEGSDYRD
jgi:ribulose-5-phosphate 4-epimerase/fuculose-1-phosphate aldolase